MRAFKTAALIGVSALAACSAGPVQTSLLDSTKKEMHGVVIEVQGCAISEARVATCSFTATSLFQDRQVTVLGAHYTRLQDDTGVSYNTAAAFGPDAGDRTQRSATLIADTPYPFKVRAENLSTQATEIRAIAIDRMDIKGPSGIAYAKMIFARPPMVETAQDAAPLRTEAQPAAQPAPQNAVGWEMVGFWDYDGVDGQQLPYGLVLLEAPGSRGPFSWDRRLELVRHEQLRPRSRQLWPVKINREKRKVCVDAPYPTYTGYVDLPGTEYDGEYLFASCKGDG